jgi:hypothetical protein
MVLMLGWQVFTADTDAQERRVSPPATNMRRSVV